LKPEADWLTLGMNSPPSLIIAFAIIFYSAADEEYLFFLLKNHIILEESLSFLAVLPLFSDENLDKILSAS